MSDSWDDNGLDYFFFFYVPRRWWSWKAWKLSIELKWYLQEKLLKNVKRAEELDKIIDAQNKRTPKTYQPPTK